MSDWPFADPKNVAVFTVRQVMDKSMPILRVRHDESDGAWQFLTGEILNLNDAMLVALEEVCTVDPGIAELADLPLGWCATRTFLNGPWTRFHDPEGDENP